MKQKIILFTAGLLATAGIINAETTNGTAGANIIVDLTIEERYILSFGRIIPGTQESVVRFSPIHAGLEVLSGDATIPSDSTLNNGYNLGGFTLTGEPNQSLSTVSVSSTGTLTDGTNTLNIAYTGRSIPTALNQFGKATFAVGASLTIPANATAGAYTGTYEVSYSY